MYEIALVDDELKWADALEACLQRFSREHQTPLHVVRFDSAMDLLEDYKSIYDLIFMDIRMPYLNGMDAAKRLRELDDSVLLIFTTSFASYAVDGYEVGAFAYMVKPFTYEEFSLKFKRACLRLSHREQAALFVRTEDGVLRIPHGEIAFCEVRGHNTVLHTLRGDYSQSVTLRSLEESLPAQWFVRCNHCYLVNLRYVSELRGEEALVSCGDRTYPLAVSRSRRKEFHEAFGAFRSGLLGKDTGR